MLYCILISVFYWLKYGMPVPVAARSKACFCIRSPAEILGSNSSGGHGCLSVVSVVCCQVEVCASDRSPIQRSPTDCVVSECNHESSIMTSPWPTRGLKRHGERNMGWRKMGGTFSLIKLNVRVSKPPDSRNKDDIKQALTSLHAS